MTSSSAIDTLLSFTDNVDATDGDNAVRRTRFLQYLQEVNDDVWNFYDWTFKYTSATKVATIAASSIVLPTNFAEFGNHGGVWLGTSQLMEISLRDLTMGRQAGVFPGTSAPGIFAMAGMDSTGAKKLELPVASTAYTLTLFFIARPYTLADLTTSSNNLQYIPAEYHNTVIIPGTAYKIHRDKGEQADYWDQYQRGLGYMVKRERERKTVVSRMPRAVNSW